MDANLDAKTVARNLWRDSMQDGLMELLLGIYFLVTGFVIQANMSALFIIFMAFLPTVAKKMKERFTHPRIGYVKFPDHEKSPGRRIMAALVAAVIAIAMVIFLARVGEKTQVLYKWIVLVPALVLAAGLTFTGQKTGFVRYYLMAALSLVSGLLIPFINLPDRMDAISLYFLIIGLVLLVWGAIVFANFLRTYPIRTEEAQ
jgi:hypothetical protein